MRKATLALAALTLVVGSALCRADDTTNPQTSPGAGNAVNAPAANPASPGTPSAGAPSATAAPQVAQTPPADWTKLQGTVQAVDPAAKTVQIQDPTGAVLQIPVDRQVSIKKDGSRIKLSQIQVGDSITLAKRAPSSQEQQKSQTMN
jgi:hypothetical protein